MLGIPLRYLLKHPLAVGGLLADPMETWMRIRDIYVDERERRGPQCLYESDEDWEQWVYARLGFE